MTFPTHPDAMSAGFIAAALGQPADCLAGFTHAPVGTGQICDSFRLTLDWRAPGAGRPASVIAKCPSSDERSRGAAALFNLYRNEAGWYRDLAAISGVACPAGHHVALSDDGASCLLLLEDCAPARQGDQLAGATRDQVAAALRQAARLHAFRPAGGFARLAWLGDGTANRALLQRTLPAIYPQFRDRFAGRLSADVLALGQVLTDRIDAYLTPRGTDPALVHGDLRIDNILFGGVVPAILLDWQTLGLGHPAADVAYLIGTSFADPDARRGAEDGLIAGYLAAHLSVGGNADEAEFRQCVRLYALGGLLMAINASIHVVQTERGDAMFAAMAERPAQMALDWDSVGLL